MTARDHPAAHRRLRELMADLARDVPGPFSGFARTHASAVTEGALPPYVKELMALAIAVCAHCEGCVAFHVHDALRAGATHEQVTEAIGVAIMMGGGPAVVYGAEALDALRQFESSPPPSEGGPHSDGTSTQSAA
jgi:AhpD family alkylhydroperoxidase